MVVVWDEPKRFANIVKHGFDFAEFDTCFGFDDFRMLAARPSRTGRSRFVMIGRWRGGEQFDGVVAAIVSPLGSEALALISLRTVSAREKAAFDAQK